MIASALDVAQVKEHALALGFSRVGIARVEPLEPEASYLRAWLAEGRHGSMRWMEESAEVRSSPNHPRMLEGARSIIVMAAPYARPAGEARGPAPAVVARYARGRDYHNVLGKRARQLAATLRQHGHRARSAVDSMPVFERAWAQRAGLGFIGKNCCLIIPGLGSHVLLAAVITTLELAPDEPMSERCGSCTRCLTGCPTGAFVEPRQLDARRCISYLTIEHRGAIPAELREAIDDRLFGCDECQDVCPFNRTAPPSTEVTRAFAPHSRWTERALPELLAMSEPEFDAYSEGSPIRRAGRDGMARNAAIVLGNRGDSRHLPVLREAATASDEVVGEHARWAIDRIERRGG